MKHLNIIPFKRTSKSYPPSVQPYQMDLVEKPYYYVGERSIEPIDLIEQWQLGHHLACVIKYISRAGRKDEIILDLNKALWYLNRELNKTNYYFILGTVDKGNSISPSQVANDWKLNQNLSSILELIWSDRTCRHDNKNHFLIHAVKLLKREIDYLSQNN